MDESGFQVYPGLPPPYQEGITFDKHVESTETAAARAWGSPVSDPASPDSPGSVRKRPAVTSLGGNGDREVAYHSLQRYVGYAPVKSIMCLEKTAVLDAGGGDLMKKVF